MLTPEEIESVLLDLGALGDKIADSVGSGCAAICRERRIASEAIDGLGGFDRVAMLEDDYKAMGLKMSGADDSAVAALARERRLCLKEIRDAQEADEESVFEQMSKREATVPQIPARRSYERST